MGSSGRQAVHGSAELTASVRLMAITATRLNAYEVVEDGRACVELALRCGVVGPDPLAWLLLALVGLLISLIFWAPFFEELGSGSWLAALWLLPALAVTLLSLAALIPLAKGCALPE